MSIQTPFEIGTKLTLNMPTLLISALPHMFLYKMSFLDSVEYDPK